MARIADMSFFGMLNRTVSVLARSGAVGDLGGLDDDWSVELSGVRCRRSSGAGRESLTEIERELVDVRYYVGASVVVDSDRRVRDGADDLEVLYVRDVDGGDGVVHHRVVFCRRVR